MIKVHCIYLLLLISFFSNGQQKIVFVLDSNIDTNKDNVMFQTKNKFPLTDFYIESDLEVHKDTVRNSYSLTIYKPTIFLVAMPPDINLYNEVYLNTEDTICISKETVGESNKRLIFRGKNDSGYNKYNLTLIEEEWVNSSPVPFYKDGTDLNEHKEIVKEWISQKRTFFRNYYIDSSADKDYNEFINSRIDCEYTFLLLFPLFDGVVKFPDNYMDGNLTGDYNSRFFVLASPLYIRWYREIKNYDLGDMKKHIDQNFKDDIKEYLLSLMMGIYADGGNVDSSEYLKLSEQYENIFHQKDYVDYLKGAKSYFMKSLTSIPDSILKSTYLETIDSDKADTAYSLFEKYKNKCVVIDFWASWCSPCIKDIKQSNVIKELLSQMDVEYIYISIDKNRNEWASAAGKLGITDKQYRLIDFKNSPLTAFFKLNSIPRYIFFGEGFSVKNLNGRPPLEGYVEYYKSVFDR